MTRCSVSGDGEILFKYHNIRISSCRSIYNTNIIFSSRGGGGEIVISIPCGRFGDAIWRFNSESYGSDARGLLAKLPRRRTQQIMHARRRRLVIFKRKRRKTLSPLSRTYNIILYTPART